MSFLDDVPVSDEQQGYDEGRASVATDAEIRKEFADLTRDNYNRGHNAGFACGVMCAVLDALAAEEQQQQPETSPSSSLRSEVAGVMLKIQRLEQTKVEAVITCMIELGDDDEDDEQQDVSDSFRIQLVDLVGRFVALVHGQQKSHLVPADAMQFLSQVLKDSAFRDSNDNVAVIADKQQQPTTNGGGGGGLDCSSSKSQDHVDERVRDIDTAIAALRAQIAALEAEKVHLVQQAGGASGDAADGQQGGGARGARQQETSAAADAEAESLLSQFAPLPDELKEAKTADGCASLTATLEVGAAASAADAASTEGGGDGSDSGGGGGGGGGDSATEKTTSSGESARLRDLISRNAASLALDLYGCQLLSKFLETMSDREELMQLVNALAGHVRVIALINHGSRLLQRIAETAAPTPHVAEALVGSCLPHMVSLACEANGSHLLMRFVGPKYSSCDRAPLYRKVSRDAVELAKSRHGCGFLQRAIESCPDAELKKIMITPILDSVLELVRDPFGNYVVQFILDSKLESHIEHVVRSLLHHIAQYACNKFGSNVIEKCVRLASPDVRQLLIDEITDPSVVAKLVTDEFANYVMQTAIVSGSDAQFLQIQSAIRPFVSALKTSPHGAKIESRMTKRVKDMQRAAAASRNSAARANAAAAAAGAMPSSGGGGGGGGGGSGRPQTHSGGGQHQQHHHGGGHHHHHHHHHHHGNRHHQQHHHQQQQGVNQSQQSGAGVMPGLSLPLHHHHHHHHHAHIFAAAAPSGQLPHQQQHHHNRGVHSGNQPPPPFPGSLLAAGAGGGGGGGGGAGAGSGPGAIGTMQQSNQQSSPHQQQQSNQQPAFQLSPQQAAMFQMALAASVSGNTGNNNHNNNNNNNNAVGGGGLQQPQQSNSGTFSNPAAPTLPAPGGYGAAGGGGGGGGGGAPQQQQQQPGDAGAWGPLLFQQPRQ